MTLNDPPQPQCFVHPTPPQQRNLHVDSAIYCSYFDAQTKQQFRRCVLSNMPFAPWTCWSVVAAMLSSFDEVGDIPAGETRPTADDFDTLTDGDSIPDPEEELDPANEAPAPAGLTHTEASLKNYRNVFGCGMQFMGKLRQHGKNHMFDSSEAKWGWFSMTESPKN